MKKSIKNLIYFINNPLAIYGPAFVVSLTRIFFSLMALHRFSPIYSFRGFNEYKNSHFGGGVYPVIENFSFHDNVFMFIAFSIFFYVSLISMLFGYKTKISTLMSGIACMLTVFIYDPRHHPYLIGLAIFLLFFSDSSRTLSLDSKSIVLKNESVKFWPIILILIQMSAIYLWGTYAKLNFDYLSGSRLESILYFYWPFENFEYTSLTKNIVIFLTYSTLILEILLGVGLWFKKIQIPLFISGCIMHFMMHFCLPIGSFTLMVYFIYFLYFIVVNYTEFKIESN